MKMPKIPKKITYPLIGLAALGAVAATSIPGCNRLMANISAAYRKAVQNFRYDYLEGNRAKNHKAYEKDRQDANKLAIAFGTDISDIEYKGRDNDEKGTYRELFEGKMLGVPCKIYKLGFLFEKEPDHIIIYFETSENIIYIKDNPQKNTIDRKDEIGLMLSNGIVFYNSLIFPFRTFPCGEHSYEEYKIKLGDSKEFDDLVLSSAGHLLTGIEDSKRKHNEKPISYDSNYLKKIFEDAKDTFTTQEIGRGY